MVEKEEGRWECKMEIVENDGNEECEGENEEKNKDERKENEKIEKERKKENKKKMDWLGKF